jgi:hypothetical protein
LHCKYFELQAKEDGNSGSCNNSTDDADATDDSCVTHGSDHPDASFSVYAQGMNSQAEGFSVPMHKVRNQDRPALLQRLKSNKTKNTNFKEYLERIQRPGAPALDRLLSPRQSPEYLERVQRPGAQALDPPLSPRQSPEYLERVQLPGAPALDPPLSPTLFSIFVMPKPSIIAPALDSAALLFGPSPIEIIARAFDPASPAQLTSRPSSPPKLLLPISIPDLCDDPLQQVVSRRFGRLSLRKPPFPVVQCRETAVQTSPRTTLDSSAQTSPCDHHYVTVSELRDEHCLLVANILSVLRDEHRHLLSNVVAIVASEL